VAELASESSGDPHEGSLEARLRASLGALVTDGLVPYNVSEKGGDLLTLRIVESRIDLPPAADEDAREAAVTLALTAVLSEAVARLTAHRKSRKVLKYVLPLKPEFLGTPVEERRTAAGQQLKDGTKTVKAGTVRTYHEPRALDRLASVLVAMEQEFCAGLLSDADESVS
jgi:hypothetical protein